MKKLRLLAAVLAVACLLSLLPAAAAGENKLYVNCDYTSATEGWGTTHFSSYFSAYSYATANAKKSTIVVEKTASVSGNCFEDSHEYYSNLAVKIQNGAVMGNALSKWDMTYPVTVNAGGKLQSARGTGSSVGNTHVKNTLTVGEAGSVTQAVIDFHRGTYQNMSIAVLYNGKLIANNALIKVADFGLTGSANITDSTVNANGIVAFGKGIFYKHTLTRSTVTVIGHNLMNGNKYYSTTGTLLHNLTMDASSVTVDDGVAETVAEKVTAKTLTLKNGSSVTVEPGTDFAIDAKLTMDSSSWLDVGAITFGTSGKIVLDATGLQVGSKNEVIIRTESAKPADFLDKFDVITEEGTAVLLTLDSTDDDKIILRKVPCFDVMFDAAGNAAPAVKHTAGKLPAAPSAIKGYDFDGWYTDETCTAPFDTDADFNVVYAKWTVADLTGTAKVSNGSTESGETLTVTVSSHNNTGDFTYQWYRYANGDGQPIKGATSQSYVVTDADAEYALFALVGSTVQTGTLQSTAAQVAPLKTFADGSITVQSYTGIYDGEAHSVSVAVPAGASVKYSTDGENFTETAPSFTNAGSYTVYYSVAQPKYAPVRGSFTVTVEPKEVTLTWSDLSADLVYNGKANTLSAKAEGLLAGDTCTVEVEPVGSNVNAGSFCYRAVSLSNANYTLPAETESPVYTIAPRKITVTVVDSEIYVGDWPEYSYTVEGLLPNDELLCGPGFGTSADFKKPGEYYVYPDGADAGPNYTVNYVEGKLTVKEIPAASSPAYTVNTANAVNGSLFVSAATAYEGDTVTVTVVPKAGYALGTLTVNANGTAVALTKVSNTVYTFTMPAANAAVSATFAEIEVPAADCDGTEDCPVAEYIDMDADAWYHDGVHYCVENGLMVGVSADRFAPEDAMTRASLVTVLWRMEGEPRVEHKLTFADVAEGEWYTEAIAWANAAGIVEGYNSRRFGPDDAVTREQMAAILYRYAALKGEASAIAENKADDFADWKKVSGWAKTAVAWACDEGLLEGKENGGKLTLAPTDTATRAQTANIIYRYIENI